MLKHSQILTISINLDIRFAEMKISRLYFPQTSQGRSLQNMIYIMFYKDQVYNFDFVIPWTWKLQLVTKNGCLLRMGTSSQAYAYFSAHVWYCILNFNGLLSKIYTCMIKVGVNKKVYGISPALWWWRDIKSTLVLCLHRKHISMLRECAC